MTKRDAPSRVVGRQQTIEGGTTWDEVERHIEKIVRIFGLDKVVVGCSFGDDSAVLTDILIQKYGRKFPVVFENTGIQFHETYRYRDEMVNDFWRLEEYSETRPNQRFPKIVQRIGLHGIMANKMICCSEMKNDPMAQWMKANGKVATLGGLRLKEAKRNECYDIMGHNAGRDIWYCNPMLFLTAQDVEDYFNDTGLKRNPLYDEPYCARRTGCAVCPNAMKGTGYASHPTYYDWLQHHFPQWYRLAWNCQRLFYKRLKERGKEYETRDYFYGHKWQWSFNGSSNHEGRGVDKRGQVT